MCDDREPLHGLELRLNSWDMNRFEAKFFCFFESFLELCNRLDNTSQRDFSEEESVVEGLFLIRGEKSCNDGEIDRRFTN